MFIEELLILALEFVFELLLNLVAYSPLDLLLWWRERKKPPEERPSDTWIVPFSGLALGGLLGGLSLIFAPTALIRRAEARLANLILAPLVCGALALALARRRVRHGQASGAKLHFWFSFTFSVAFLMVRFIWAHRTS